jgi:hypothetical protein
MSETEVLRSCYVCKRQLPEASFACDRTRSTGRKSFCEECRPEKNRITAAAQRAKYKLKWGDLCASCGKEKLKRRALYCSKLCAHRARWLREKYGMSLDEFMDQLARQDCECAICHDMLQESNGRDGKGAVVDHCHTTGKVRNLLCRKCNAGLGMFRDDPQLLAAGATYLEVHK